MNYSTEILKKSVFQDEVMNVLEFDSAKLKMGSLAHGIVLAYFKSRMKEIDENLKN